MNKAIALKLSTYALIVFAAAAVPSSVVADYGLTAQAGQPCTTQYGTSTYGSNTPCTTTKVTINKKVLNPVTNTYVENLSSTDPSFSPGANVVYSITVTNTGNQDLTGVIVKDTLPDVLSFESGAGTYNSANRTITFTLDSLKAGQSHTEYVLTKVGTASADFFCVRNSVTVGTANSPAMDTDQAQICITTKVLGTTTLPVAGFNDLLLLIPFAGVGAAGLAMLKKRA